MKTFKPIERIYCGWQPKKYYRGVWKLPDVSINVEPTYGFVRVSGFVKDLKPIHNYEKGDIVKIVGEKDGFIDTQNIFTGMKQYVYKEDLLLC